MSDYKNPAWPPDAESVRAVFEPGMTNPIDELGEQVSALSTSHESLKSSFSTLEEKVNDIMRERAKLLDFTAKVVRFLGTAEVKEAIEKLRDKWNDDPEWLESMLRSAKEHEVAISLESLLGVKK